MDRVTIRPVKVGDEHRLATVHIKSWQEAYAGLMPEQYLEQLPSEHNQRVEMWSRVIANPARWAWAAVDNDEIVGFVLFGPPRDKNRDGFIELGAIYLLESHKNKKIGFSLLSAGFNKMKGLGYKRAYCWVLENNPTIKFYERTGAKFSSEVKQDEIGGKSFKELLYEWDDINIGEFKSTLKKALEMSDIKSDS